jgi:hypothetical protein
MKAFRGVKVVLLWGCFPRWRSEGVTLIASSQNKYGRDLFSTDQI